MTPQEMIDLTESWKPYRSVGVFFFLSYLGAKMAENLSFLPFLASFVILRDGTIGVYYMWSLADSSGK